MRILKEAGVIETEATAQESVRNGHAFGAQLAAGPQQREIKLSSSGKESNPKMNNKEIIKSGIGNLLTVPGSRENPKNKEI